MSKTTSTRRWLHYAEAAAYVGLSKRQMRRLVSQGRVPHTKLGLHTLFDPDELDRWVETRTRRPGVSA